MIPMTRIIPWLIDLFLYLNLGFKKVGQFTWHFHNTLPRNLGPSCHRLQHGTPNDVWQQGVSVRTCSPPQLDSCWYWKKPSKSGKQHTYTNWRLQVLVCKQCICVRVCTCLFLKQPLEHVWSNRVTTAAGCAFIEIGHNFLHFSTCCCCCILLCITSAVTAWPNL